MQAKENGRNNINKVIPPVLGKKAGDKQIGIVHFGSLYIGSFTKTKFQEKVNQM
jgi:hypothetical protein